MPYYYKYTQHLYHTNSGQRVIFLVFFLIRINKGTENKVLPTKGDSIMSPSPTRKMFSVCKNCANPNPHGHFLDESGRPLIPLPVFSIRDAEGWIGALKFLTKDEIDALKEDIRISGIPVEYVYDLTASAEARHELINRLLADSKNHTVEIYNVLDDILVEMFGMNNQGRLH
ncbi:MAG: hypothetical protein EOM19_03095 [Candidatus Moranbacteria bacterium]|nr:hypothetical protein [Candidatus Moranbacteria bacterium]